MSRVASCGQLSFFAAKSARGLAHQGAGANSVRLIRSWFFGFSVFRRGSGGILAAEVELGVNEGGGGAEGIVEVVDGESGVIAGGFEDDGGAVAGGHVNASGGGDGGGEDEIADASKRGEDRSVIRQC